MSRSSMAAHASRGFSAAAVPSSVSGSPVGSMSSRGCAPIAGAVVEVVEDLKRLWITNYQLKSEEPPDHHEKKELLLIYIFF